MSLLYTLTSLIYRRRCIFYSTLNIPQNLKKKKKEFVVSSLPCDERFCSGYSSFPISLKTNIPNSNSIWKARTCLNEFIRTTKCPVGKQITIIVTIELGPFLFSGYRDACKGLAQFETVIRTRPTHLPNFQIFSTETLAPNASGLSIFFFLFFKVKGK